MAEHPSQVMRRASARLREAGSAATPPPWRVSYIDGEPVIDGPGPDGDLVAEIYRCPYPAHAGREKADATLVVLLRNSAEALAGWLEGEAERAESEVITGRGWHAGCSGLVAGQPERLCACWDGALATARAILGESDEAATAAGGEN